MSTLQQEYRKRHGGDFIWPCQAGVCFFDSDNGQPATIVTTSLQGQSNSNCGQCACATTGVVVEVFVPTPWPGTSPYYTQTGHYHIAPDLDLLRFVRTLGAKRLVWGGGTKPFVAAKYSDLEVWLWKWFFAAVEKSNKWEKLPAQEAMAWYALRRNLTYQLYYSLCEKFLAGRKYILIDDSQT